MCCALAVTLKQAMRQAESERVRQGAAGTQSGGLEKKAFGHHVAQHDVNVSEVNCHESSHGDY